MADLDDFFAKKDRKKSKSVKKFATADELAKKLEDTKQKSDVRPKKERPIQEGDESGRAAEEEEWKEYEEPVKDYTGLKLQVLQGGTGAPESGRDLTSEDYAPDSGKIKGPWNKPQVESAAVEAPPPPAPTPQAAEPKAAVYMPPSSRQNQQRPSEPRRPQSKHAPDINNDAYFPVLGAAKRAPGWGAPASAAPASRVQVSIDNRFNSLQDDS